MFDKLISDPEDLTESWTAVIVACYSARGLQLENRGNAAGTRHPFHTQRKGSTDIGPYSSKFTICCDDYGSAP
jgi:hypothetical protein